MPVLLCQLHGFLVYRRRQDIPENSEGNLFKWPYQSRGATQKAQESASTVVPPSLDFNLFSGNDSFIKVWLPERIESVLDKLSADHKVSRPDAMRAILFQHVYGVLMYEQLLDWKRKQDEANQCYYQSAVPDAGEALFSRSRTSLGILGKSTTNLKLWLPARLKEDLLGVATQHALGVSDYVRWTFARVLLGEKFVADWRRTLQELPDGVKADEAES